MMIMVASPKSFPESLKEGDEGIQIEENDETVKPTQALPALEGAGQTEDELLEINLSSDEEPRLTYINVNASPKEKDMYS